MISFEELTHQVYLIDNLIISEIVHDEEDDTAEKLNFSKHLVSTRYFFTRISNVNKKRYLHALVSNITSVWVLSLLLKAIWNCRPKDAYMSVTEIYPYSGYDIAPMDSNRTARSLETLSHIMKNERKWFVSLSPDSQMMVFCELLSMAGGPVIWSVYRKAHKVYNDHQFYLMNNIEICIPVEIVKNSSLTPKDKSSASVKSPAKIDTQQTLQANLNKWNQIIKSLRDSLKIEEMDMTFKSGERRKVWRVNRPRPELTETVDIIQLLPGDIGKMILAYLPLNFLNECTKVNRYWAFLIGELKEELAARRKINEDLAKLRENILFHDGSLDLLDMPSLESMGPSIKGAKWGHKKTTTDSLHLSETTAASFKHFLRRFSETNDLISRPIHNLREMQERLDTRGAADANLWRWCNITVRTNRKSAIVREKEGVTEDIHLPCPLLKMKLSVPLKTPLRKDPSFKTKRHSSKLKQVISISTLVSMPRKTKKIKLWSKDLSLLYPVSKIPSYYCYYQ